MRKQPRFRHLRALTAAWVLFLTPAVLAATPESGPLAGTPEDRIVAFGDVHGGFDELRSLLAALGLIDTELNWQGGRTRLVSLGDLLDRGPDSRRVMDLLMRLEEQAGAAGGAVHIVPGNHEIMNLTGDLRYVSQAEYAAFASDEDPQTRRLAREQYLARAQLEVEAAVAREADTGVQTADRGPEDPTITFERQFPPGYFGHRAAFAADGRYGSWLLGKPQVLVLERIAFVHGGLSTAFVGLSIEDHNTAAAAEIRQLLALGTQLVGSGQIEPWQDILSAPPLNAEAALPAGLLALRESFQFAEDGPSWYRGTAACHPLLEQPRFEAVLANRGLEKVVMGHTPTFPRQLQTRFSGRAVLADTGMYEAYYHGRPAAVVFAGNETRFLSQ
ncbi:MAG TPA: metallophosphoesterase, partial [Pseudomonadales bacterium]